MKNHYETLGVSPVASAEEIKKAYFALAKQAHPDSVKTADTKKFNELSEAYAVLSDTDKRRDYDLTLPIVPARHETSAVREKAIYRTPETKEAYEVNKRQNELIEFEQHRFRMAAARVGAFSLLSGLVGSFVAALMGASTVIGFLAALGIGLVLSGQKNFDLDSFVHGRQNRLYFRLGRWAILLMGAGVFAKLLLK